MWSTLALFVVAVAVVDDDDDDADDDVLVLLLCVAHACMLLGSGSSRVDSTPAPPCGVFFWGFLSNFCCVHVCVVEAALREPCVEGQFM